MLEVILEIWGFKTDSDEVCVVSGHLWAAKPWTSEEMTEDAVLSLPWLESVLSLVIAAR